MKRAIDVNLVAKDPADGKVRANIDGIDIVVDPGLTIWEAANLQGIDVPALCHQDERMQDKYVDLNPVGVCRLCCVELGEVDRRDKKLKFNKVLVPSCMRPIEQGMVIRTHGGNVDIARKTLVELLLADHPEGGCSRHIEFGDCELEVLAEKYGLQKRMRDQNGAVRCERHVAFSGRSREAIEAAKGRRPEFAKGVDHSNPMIRIDHAACIVCDRCVRACTDIKDNNVIGRVGKGYATTIGFDLDVPMDESTCVNCGECMITCPTGAITYAAAAGQNLPCDEPLTVEQLQEFAIFQGISANFLELAAGSICVRTYQRGEEICHQGDFGSTAFYIVEGECEVYIEPPALKAKRAETRGVIGNLLSIFSSKPPRDQADRAPLPATITIDAPTDLEYKPGLGRWVNTLGAGSLVGEMACINFQPRSATVVAHSDQVKVIEFLRNVLDLLRKNKAFRERMDRDYREKALHGHLQTVELFRDLPGEFLREMERRADLQRLRPGQVICREDDPADGFYVVRSGHVKIARRGAVADIVIRYLRRGDVFGEVAMLGMLGLLEAGFPGADGRRTASCTALDHVDLVRFDIDIFRDLLARFPDVATRLKTLAEQRLRGTDSRAGPSPGRAHAAKIDLTSATRYAGDPRFGQFIDQGLYQAQNMLVLDLERCTRCDECVRACADTHGGVTKMARDGLRFDKYLVATSCRACHDPVCMVGCPVGSIRRREGAEIVIEDWCIGCGLCEQNCPYGSINMIDLVKDMTLQVEQERSTRKAEMRRASVCDLSSELGEPACVHACPHDAAFRVTGESLLESVMFAQPLQPAPRPRG